MSDILTIVLNDVSQIEYDRRKPLTEKQRQYLDKMDLEMDQGFILAGAEITSANALQRAQFIALSLFAAIEAQNELLAAALCTYLAHRLQDLQQVKAIEKQGLKLYDLVFDEAYSKRETLHFVSPNAHKAKSH